MLSQRVVEVAWARVKGQLRESGVALSGEQLETMAAGVKDLAAHGSKNKPSVEMTNAVVKQVAGYLKSGESMLDDSNKAQAEGLAAAVAGLGPQASEAAVAEAVAGVLQRDDDDEVVKDVAWSMMTPVAEAWRQEQQRGFARKLLAAAEVTLPAGNAGERVVRGVANALLDLKNETALVPAAQGGHGVLSWKVSGLPVLYRGLASSVTDNQLKSLALALALVVVILVLLFRSLKGGLLAAAPTALTLLVVYGAMGVMGLHLDIGTSMLASIIIGAGVDYAVHLLAAWRGGNDGERTARLAAEHAGPAIATNALMVAAGFFVLTLGQARPLQNVGGLTAAAMLVAAVVTFLLLAALAGHGRYAPWQVDNESS